MPAALRQEAQPGDAGFREAVRTTPHPKPPTLFELLGEFESAADAARVRAWARDGVAWYLEPNTELARDHARAVLAIELVRALGATKAESLAVTLQHIGVDNLGENEMGHIAAAAEIRKAIKTLDDEAAERFAESA